MTARRLLASLALAGALLATITVAQGDAGAPRAPKEPKEAKEPKEPKEAKEPKEPKEPKDAVKDPKAEKEPAPAGAPAAAAAAADPDPDDDHKDPVPTNPKGGPKEPVAVRQPTIVKDGMVRIPGGHFTMGSSEKGAPANERPARSVVVPPFWIDKTEVTVGAYKACVDRGACTRPSRTSAHCTYDAGDPQLPVNCISWSMANAFCMAAGKRLAREVEWEYAARGPTPVKYPWGGQGTSCGMAATLSREGAFRPCSGKLPARAGAHVAGASPFGVLDMAGNVEEWTADWYAESVSEASPRAGSAHVLRGGGWLSSPAAARTTTRNWGSVRESGPNVGFRCAKDD
jgi:formylglycine-generating enzyme required for sulfatase activity